MRTIYKYEMRLADQFEVQMPRGAEVLIVGLQGSSIFAWALIDPGEQMVRHRFRVLGTGHPTDEETSRAAHRGIVIFPNSGLVFHFFDMGEPDAAG